MCTATWAATEHGPVVLFNRDESRLRSPGLPPRVERTTTGVRYLAPIDSDAGGTWIAVNEHGTTVALLNRYRDTTAQLAAGIEPPGGWTSRGHLVRALADGAHADDVTLGLERLEVTRFRPFTLLVVDARSTVRVVASPGDGDLLSLPARAPLSSSGFDTDAVASAREAHWRNSFAANSSDPAGDSATRDALARQLAFHQSHLPERGPLSPCMHRLEASTVSLVRVEVDRNRVRMAYAPGPPCRTPLDAPIELARA